MQRLAIQDSQLESFSSSRGSSAVHGLYPDGPSGPLLEARGLRLDTAQHAVPGRGTDVAACGLQGALQCTI